MEDLTELVEVGDSEQPFIRASSSSGRRSSASRSPTTSSPAWKARARSAASVSSFTRRRGSSTRAGTVT
jgi:hypothetical protein